jgi:hypothetical protein
MKVIYKITYPNGKIYIGKDSTDKFTYFGSPCNEYIEKDFSYEEKQDFTIRKQIIWSSESISESDLIKKENEFITKLESNNPLIGYNLMPKYN